MSVTASPSYPVSRRGAGAVERGGLENRCALRGAPWVRIPPPPLDHTAAHAADEASCQRDELSRRIENRVTDAVMIVLFACVAAIMVAGAYVALRYIISLA
jgi:hypothetical protein